MKFRITLFLLFIAVFCAASAQRKKKAQVLEVPELAEEVQEPVSDTIALQRMAAHLAMFGNEIPQEKVFLHLDNTCYFLGDTIWFAAYTQQTNTSLPSTVSRVLYVELLNQDGYLMERQLIKMENGRGCGQFELKENYYGGYYELRAYTRWQLNFGAKVHEHTSYAKSWFQNSKAYQDFYRDYDKLYSRVFPVYDKPKEDGYFVRDMTLRPLRRYFHSAGEPPALVLSLFPEGGNLVAGVENRVAFEAADEEGEWKEGRLELLDDDRVVAKAKTEHRGRGTFAFTPEKGKKYTAVFYTQAFDTIADPSRKERKHLTIKEKLEKAEESGATVRAEREGEGWRISVMPVGGFANGPLGLTLMHEGQLEAYRTVNGAESFLFAEENVQAGVHQVTVFDRDGRVLCDRLFFETKPALFRPTLSVSGIRERYKAFDPINFTLKSQPYTPALPFAANNSAMRATVPTVSLSVRDGVLQDYTYDTGNIMTEMLLASEIKGYVPHPDWYFEADDAEHQRALDLLMLTQGWRRFEWKSMALPKAFTLNHPAEYTQILNGEVYNYYAYKKENPLDIKNDLDTETPLQYDLLIVPLDPESPTYFKDVEESLYILHHHDSAEYAIKCRQKRLSASIDSGNGGDAGNDSPDLPNYEVSSAEMDRFAHLTEGKYGSSGLKREVLVHAEFYRPGDEGLEGEMMTEGGRFTIPAPDFEGSCFMMLAASDSTKWKHPEKPAKNIYRRIRQTHQWVNKNEDDYPEFTVRLNYPYPRFVKPYDYYQKHMSDYVSNRYPNDLPGVNDDRFHRTLENVTVRARRNGLRAFDKTKPAFRLDAYDAFNNAVDAGVTSAFFAGSGSLSAPLAFSFVGDMNVYRSYNVKTRYEGDDASNGRFQPDGIRARYNYLHNLDSVYIYTDYQPRLEGSKRYEGSDQPEVVVNFNLIPNDGVRASYRDRRIVIDGFSVAEDFYHPNYHAAKPKPEEQKDYRRTLYWNPALPLDPSGETRVTLYNCGKLTTVNVSAAGMTSDGQWLYLSE